MSNAINAFLESVLNSEVLDEKAVLIDGFDLIKTQLVAYLKLQELSAVTFTCAIKQARKLQNIETDPKFWCALESFYLAVGDCIDGETEKMRWLRFVNIIEKLQGYNGSQLIYDKNIRTKRIKRLLLAFTLTWEHLRYIADNEDDYNPSELIISRYSNAHSHE